MIKLGVFSDDLAADWYRAIQVAQETGVQGLEIRNVYGRSSKDLSNEEAKGMATALKGTGLEISCMGSTYGRQFWLDDPESKRSTEDVLAKIIRFCDIFDTNKIRIFALWIPGYEGHREKWPVRPRFSLDLLTRIAKNLETSVKMAEQAGVQLLIEGEPLSYSGNCREARVIMEAIDSPTVQCIYHPRVTGLTGEVTYPEGYNQVRGFIKHVHMGRLDYYWNGAEADVPHRQVLEALVADQYDGWITVERHFHPRDPEKEPELRSQTIGDIKAVSQMLAQTAKTT